MGLSEKEKTDLLSAGNTQSLVGVNRTLEESPCFYLQIWIMGKNVWLHGLVIQVQGRLIQLQNPHHHSGMPPWASTMIAL